MEKMVGAGNGSDMGAKFSAINDLEKVEVSIDLYVHSMFIGNRRTLFFMLGCFSLLFYFLC